MNDQEANIKFVQEVEKHPVLYNYNLPGYSRRNLTDKAWNEVADEVNMTVAECKDKWRNLRTVFARKMKLPPSGSGAKKRKAYYLADVMHFALPFIKTSATNLAEVPEEDNSQGIYQDSCEVLIYDDEDDHEQDCRSEASSVTQNLPSPLPSPSTSTFTSVHAENRKTEKNYSSSQKNYKKMMTPKQKAEVEAVTAYFQAKRSQIDAIPIQRNSEDERKEALRMFLLSLMPELLQFSDNELKLFKRRVFGLIDDIASIETLNHK